MPTHDTTTGSLGSQDRQRDDGDDGDPESGRPRDVQYSEDVVPGRSVGGDDDADPEPDLGERDCGRERVQFDSLRPIVLSRPIVANDEDDLVIA